MDRPENQKINKIMRNAIQGNNKKIKELKRIEDASEKF